MYVMKFSMVREKKLEKHLLALVLACSLTLTAMGTLLFTAGEATGKTGVNLCLGHSHEFMVSIYKICGRNIKNMSILLPCRLDMKYLAPTYLGMFVFSFN